MRKQRQTQEQARKLLLDRAQHLAREKIIQKCKTIGFMYCDWNAKNVDEFGVNFYDGELRVRQYHHNELGRKYHAISVSYGIWSVLVAVDDLKPHYEFPALKFDQPKEQNAKQREHWQVGQYLPGVWEEIVNREFSRLNDSYSGGIAAELKRHGLDFLQEYTVNPLFIRNLRARTLNTEELKTIDAKFKTCPAFERHSGLGV